MVGVTGGKEVRCSDYATFGSAELSDAMTRALGDNKACLLANHGLVCFGPSLAKALYIAGEVEALARQYALALALGEPVLLSDEEMERVIHRLSGYGRQLPAHSQDPLAGDAPVWRG
jgi:L-fuculose-phosphate aldolase